MKIIVYLWALMFIIGAQGACPHSDLYVNQGVAKSKFIYQGVSYTGIHDYKVEAAPWFDVSHSNDTGCDSTMNHWRI